MRYIDLRSDTVTKPSRPMLEAMMNAEVGDDVFGEDPTVNRLQQRIADMFGKQAALFVPSGTMGNEICIKVYTQPGDEIIVDEDSHIFVYETAAPSLLSGVQMKTITNTKGIITAEQVKRIIRPKAYYLPSTRLICLENTHGRSGGSIFPLEHIKQIRDLAKSENIKLHLDGARLWNACEATGISPQEYAEYFDSISVCFSKGLGAPIGSIIIGDEGFIDKARKYRKLFGGGMRQAGILAAAALYALDHNVERLSEDHQKAQHFAHELATLKQLRIDVATVQTNMIIIETEGTGRTQTEILTLLKTKGLLLTPERYSAIRAVMHLDVSMDDVKQAVSVFHSLFH
ncbi:MAG: low-specificity L-threonine aldolase [Ignavibacteriae bacterium]|nr:low-specificity L-threonine aldolase [Ignavibacteriota bacterium]